MKIPGLAGDFLFWALAASDLAAQSINLAPDLV